MSQALSLPEAGFNRLLKLSWWRRTKSAALCKQIGVLSGVAILVFSLVIFVDRPAENPIAYFAVMYSIFLVLMGVLVLVLMLSIFAKPPRPVKIAVVGLPKSGKTVFLNVLLHRLLDELDPRVQFSFEDRSVEQRVMRNVERLLEKEWLPPAKNAALPYRMKVKLGGTVVHDTYKISIEERTLPKFAIPAERISSRRMWESSINNLASDPNALMITIDSGDVLGRGAMTIDELQDLYIPLLQELPREATDGVRSPVPVAIVFTKTDVVEMTLDPKALRNLIPRLLETCRKECKYFRMFYMTSVGHTDELNIPDSLSPSKNISEPLSWIVKTIE